MYDKREKMYEQNKWCEKIKDKIEKVYGENKWDEKIKLEWVSDKIYKVIKENFESDWDK